MDVLDRTSGPPPEVRNSDGDEIVFMEARFPIAGKVPEVVAGLDETDDLERDEPEELRWTWLGPGSPSKRMARQEGLAFDTGDEADRTVLGRIEIGEDTLLLSTNSKERADRGRDLLLSRLDGLIGQPRTSHRDLEQMLDEESDLPPIRSSLPAEVDEQAIHSFLDDHYRQILDEPLPGLGGKTPRQAAKTKKGRAQVTNWLKKLENSEGRRAASQGQEPHDFQWMWRELKIDYPR